jgi:hypothetical protein
MMSFERIETLARELGRSLRKLMPPGFGFTLVIYRHGEGGEMTYISSSKREDVVHLLRELAVVLEHHAEAPPGVLGHPARKGGPVS